VAEIVSGVLLGVGNAPGRCAETAAAAVISAAIKAHRRRAIMTAS
jgi:hypothetical protein